METSSCFLSQVVLAGAGATVALVLAELEEVVAEEVEY